MLYSCCINSMIENSGWAFGIWGDILFCYTHHQKFLNSKIFFNILNVKSLLLTKHLFDPKYSKINTIFTI